MKIDYIRLLIRKEMSVVGVAARGADKLVTARYATDGITARRWQPHARAHGIPVILLYTPDPGVSDSFPNYLFFFLDRQSNSLQHKTLLPQFTMLFAIWKTTVIST